MGIKQHCQNQEVTGILCRNFTDLGLCGYYRSPFLRSIISFGRRHADHWSGYGVHHLFFSAFWTPSCWNLTGALFILNLPVFTMMMEMVNLCKNRKMLPMRSSAPGRCQHKTGCLYQLGEGFEETERATTQLSDVSKCCHCQTNLYKISRYRFFPADTLADDLPRSFQDDEWKPECDSTSILQSVSCCLKTCRNWPGVTSRLPPAWKKISPLTGIHLQYADGRFHRPKIAEKYTETTDAFSKTTKMLDISAIESLAYQRAVEEISHNLSALNALYEMQLKGSHEQNYGCRQGLWFMGNFLKSLDDTIDQWDKYKAGVDNLVKNITAWIRYMATCYPPWLCPSNWSTETKTIY